MKSELMKKIIYLLKSSERLEKYNKKYLIYTKYRNTYFKKKK